MKNFGAYIHQLLLENDCVSIPGFGGMVAQHFHADLNVGTNLLRPQSKRISFHEELVANEHLIIHKVALSEKCNPDRALEMIAAEVKNWRVELANGRSVKVEGIGRFYLDYAGAICFNQSLESNLNLHSFGFDIFRANAIKREIEIKETVATAIARQKGKNMAASFWKAAAMFTGIGALLAVALLKTDVEFPRNPLANFNPLQFSRVIQIEPAPEVFMSTKEAVLTITPENTSVEESTELAPEVAATVETNTSAKPYHIIVGSFKDIANAQDLINKLSTEGYNPTVLSDGSSFAKVSLDSFDNREQATIALRAYKTSVNKSAWIYSR